MKRRITITESQLQHILNEGLGINKDIKKIAKRIIDDIYSNHIYDLLQLYKDSDEYDEEETANDEDILLYSNEYENFIDSFLDELGDNYIGRFNSRDYYYVFYYDNTVDHNSYARCIDYGDSVYININYKFIHRIIKKVQELTEKRDIDYDSSLVAWLGEYLYPVLTHELTHSLESATETQGTWLRKTNRFNEEDVKTILYLFSENEMNARVGSVVGIVDSILSTYDIDDIDNETCKGIIDDVMEDDGRQLELGYINTMFSFMERALRDSVGSYENGERTYREGNLLYLLFVNDSRLKNNRNLKKMFDSNSVTAYRYVYDFYKKLFDNYKKRIMRAAYYAVINYKDYNGNNQDF